MMLRKLEVNVISSQTLTVTKSAENLSAPCHQVSTVQYCTVLYYLDGKGQCGGTIGAVIYLNKAKPLEKENIQV